MSSQVEEQKNVQDVVERLETGNDKPAEPKKSKIRIVKLPDPHIAGQYLEEPLKWIDTVDYDPRDALELVVYKLHKEPDTTLCLFAYDENSGEICGYLFADVRTNDPYVFVYFTYVRNGIDFNISQAFYDRLLIWAEDHNKSKIRMETSREDAFARKYKFKSIKHIMELDVDSVLQEEYGNVNIGNGNQKQSERRSKEGSKGSNK